MKRWVSLLLILLSGIGARADTREIVFAQRADNLWEEVLYSFQFDGPAPASIETMPVENILATPGMQNYVKITHLYALEDSVAAEGGFRFTIKKRGALIVERREYTVSIPGAGPNVLQLVD